MEKKVSLTMITISNALNLSARGLFFEIYQMMEKSQTAHIECIEKDLAEQLNVKFPHFCKSLKILTGKGIFVKTRTGIGCPTLERAIIRSEIKKAFSKHG